MRWTVTALMMFGVGCSQSQGPQGENGPPGEQGAPGEHGRDGVPGRALLVLADGGTIVVDGGVVIVSGPTGPSGEPGAAGRDGLPGEPGRVVVLTVADGGTIEVDGGVAIVAGPAGVAGPQGPVGATGPVGSTGSVGPRGDPGVAGADGQSVTGVVELAGTNCQYGGVKYVSASGTHYVCTGATGTAGAPGAQGAIGPQGSQGPVGLAGADGQSVAGASESPGLNCTYGGVRYLSSGGTNYVCNGAPGVAGTQGPQGLIGATGPQGADGAQGLQGLQGETGLQGAPGAVGAQGPQGLTGLPGLPGATGAQGAVGPQGPTGPQGAAGADGQSVVGASESPGLNCLHGGVQYVGAGGTVYVCNGAPGAMGTAGSVGAPGPTGPAGPTGAQGPIGDTGPQGLQGTAGATGAPGQSVVGASEPIGIHCAAGGVQLVSASGTDYVCNGTTGTTGSQGPPGVAGSIGPQGIPGAPAVHLSAQAVVPPGATLTVSHGLNDNGLVTQAWARDLAGTWKSLAGNRVRLTGTDVIDDSMLSYWKMDEPAFQRPLDSGHLGLRLWGNMASSAGRFGSAADVTPGSYFFLDAPDSLPLSKASTVGAWVWANAAPSGSPPVFAHSWGGSTGRGLFFFSDASYRCLTNASTSGAFTAGPAVTLNAWHHVACVYVGNEVRLFVDGVQRATATSSGLPAVPDGRFWLGGDSGSSFPGKLDEVFVSNVAMTAAQLTAVMTGVTGYGVETLTDFRVEQPSADAVVLYNDSPRTLPLRLDVMK